MTVESIFTDDPHEGSSSLGPPRGANTSIARWHVYIGINGVWTVRQLMLLVGSDGYVPKESEVAEDRILRLFAENAGIPTSSLSFNPAVLNFTVDLDLHPEDEIHITACGFEADVLHGLIGKDSGLTWEQISDPALTEKQRREMMEDLLEEALDKNFLGFPGRRLTDENEPLGLVSEVHLPRHASESSLERPSDKGDYRLRFTIEAV